MSVPDLTQVDEALLVGEIERRNAERAKIAEEKRKRHHDYIVAGIDVLLDLAPEHGRLSCSDSNAQNEGRCTRCTLLEIKRHGWVPDYVVRISLNLVQDGTEF